MKCNRCGKPHDGPRKACEACLAKLRAWWSSSRCKRRRAARQKLGLCRLCGNLAVPGTAHCGYHLELFQERRAALYVSRLERGVCAHCGRPKAENRHACPECLEKDRLRSQQRRDHLKARIARQRKDAA